MTCKWEDGEIVFGIHSWDLMDVVLPRCLEPFMREEYLDEHSWAIKVPWPFELSGRLLAELCSGWNFEVKLNDDWRPLPTPKQQEMLVKLAEILETGDPNLVDELESWVKEVK